MLYECWLTPDAQYIQYQETQNATGLWTAPVIHPWAIPYGFDNPTNLEHYTLASIITAYWDYSTNALTADGHHLVGPYADGSFTVWGPGFNDPTYTIPGGSGLTWGQMAEIIDNQSFPPPGANTPPGDGAETGVSADTACND